MTDAASLMPLRLGTRGSALALAQATRVGDLLAAATGRPTTPVVIRTEGDADKTSPLTVIGGRGVFTSALGDALLAGRIDAAVHSAKDLPSQGTPGLALVAFPEREDPRDVLISRHGLALADLPPCSVIGTSSRRRAVQVRAVRPDARIVELRGNVDTRLRKALDPAPGEVALDAVVLAAAGVRRMGWRDRITAYLPLETFVPSPGQGALAVETREGEEASDLWAAIDDAVVARAVRAERAFLRAIGGGCTSPIGAYVAATEEGLRLWAMLADEAGEHVEWLTEQLDPESAEAEAAAIARRLVAKVAAGGSRPRPRPPAPRRPLAGVSVLVTRAAEQAPPLLAALREQGAEALALPTLRIAPAADLGPLDAALWRLAAEEAMDDWIIFTSANAVGRVVDRLSALGLGVGVLGQRSIAAIGPATAAALEAVGVVPTLTPERADAVGTASALAGRGVAGRRVLFPRGDLARETLARALRDHGALVEEVEAYRTLPVPSAETDPAVRERVRFGLVDVVTLTSPSSVRNLALLLGGSLGCLAGATVVTVGETTAAAVRARDLSVHAVAATPSVAGIVAAVVEAWQSREAAGRRLGEARPSAALEEESAANGRWAMARDVIAVGTGGGGANR